MEVLPGIFRLELPMPFELRHVNVYLLRDGETFTLIDTGLQTEESRQALNEKLAALKVPVDRIKRILITHIHPDHFGLAGELRERAEAELMVTRLAIAAFIGRPGASSFPGTTCCQKSVRTLACIRSRAPIRSTTTSRHSPGSAGSRSSWCCQRTASLLAITASELRLSRNTTTNVRPPSS